MFNLTKNYGSVDVSVPIYVMDLVDGSPETGYDHTTTGIDLWYRREGGAKVSITEAALASWDAAHADGGVEHGSDGRGRLDLPDAACAWGTDGATHVEYGGTITGMIVVGGFIQLTPPQFLSGLLSGTHTTSSADLGTNAPGQDVKGWFLWFPTRNVAVFVTSYATGTGVASFDTQSGLSLADNDPWVLFPVGAIDSATVAAIQSGLATAAALATVDSNVDAVLVDTGTTIPGQISTLDADVAADIAAVPAAVLAAAASDPIDANVEQINTVPLVGDGSATPWGP